MRAFLAIAALAAAFVAPMARAQQADPTLSPSEYVTRGMPAIERDWTPADYNAAATALAGLPLEQLPRSNSPKSGVVMDRIVNRTSLVVCQDQAIAVATRLEVCALGLTGLSGVLMRYSSALNADITRARDGLRLINLALYMSAELSEMMTAYVPTIDSSLPDYSTRMAGMNQARRGLAQMLSGSIGALETPAGIFPEDIRAETAQALATTFQRLAVNVPPEARPALDVRLRAVAQNDHNLDVRTALAAYAG